MSTILLDKIIGAGKQQTAFAGQWYLNGNITRASSGDYEYTSSNFTLDPTYANVNASSLLTPGTTFAVTAPVQGIYAIKWNHRGIFNVNGTATNIYAVYLSGHVLNGVSYSPLGTTATISRRPAEVDTWISNTQTATFSPLIHNTITCIEEFKTGDTIAPCVYFQTNNCVSVGDANVNSKLTTFSIVLLKRTA